VGWTALDHRVASCAIYDAAARRIELLTVPYDVEAAAEDILAAGLPRSLADRLAQRS
jgi:hypothetical protein